MPSTQRLTSGLLAMSIAAALLIDDRASATVTQVDGTIIPTGNQVQLILDGRGETLNAVLDAAELPEVFLPNTTQPVVFRNLAEGASFENSFGWYNVGDDITSDDGRRANLHPIFGCGSVMQNHPYDPADPLAHRGHHHGDPATYSQNSEPLDVVSVDFAAELAAGRYKGGFIGFYLITPEGLTGACGDYVFDPAPPPTNFFGFIYHTQKDLNNDGDFVHHLVYTSAVSADAFYFGFEDLFRGGDNDFEDMFIAVEGLTPPCVPTTEICDGVDNDCDGQVDVADPDLTGVGDPCLCDDVTLTCADSPVFGVCQTGVTVCTPTGPESAEIQCDPVVEPSAEVCDGLDNNCNNAVDDNPIDAGGACDGADADQCLEGVFECQSGVLVCTDNTGASVEVCNGLDDDCDGAVDEDVPQGGPCGTDLGECVAGTQQCVNGTVECVGQVPPGPEVCDLLDNDCDGVVDDNPTDVGQPCPAGGNDVGQCALGVTICSAGAPQCVGQIGPTPETCDLLDNDCDGVIDNNPVDVGGPCGIATGVCEPGVLVCGPAGPECSGGVGGTPEVCNGLDDDCNGLIDDNPAGTGGPCGTGDGVCQPGIEQCINGGLECVGGITGTTETCNGLDDDCDGNVDEGELCEDGVCEDAQCASPCGAGEFQCPLGQKCEEGFCVNDPCFGVTCPPGEDGGLDVCEDGSCVPVCDTVTCPADRVCRTTDGACVPDSCNFLPLCEDDELCVDGVCISDPCQGVDCPADQFCRGGACVRSCAGVECPAGEECRDGACMPNGCGVDCPTGHVCDGAECVQDRCGLTSCQPGEACDPRTGDCVTDPCIGVTCPGGQVCDFGDCVLPPAPPQQRITTAGAGCAVADADAGGAPWLIGALAALLAFRRRSLCRGARSRSDRTRSRSGRGRSRSGLPRAAAVALAGPVAIGLGCALAAGLLVSTASCGINPFCIDCENPGGSGDAGPGDGGAGDGGGADAPPGCEDGVAQPEQCNGLDDDCDLAVDEDFDFIDDVLNCGACGNACIKPGASTSCSEGACEIVECFPGQVDIDGDIDGPFDDSNGCEYSCFTSNGGVEACDTLDNDCDAQTDEAFDLATDPVNCGVCGLVCQFFQVSNPRCVAGACVFDPATDCNPGFHDINGVPNDGCEYQCTATGAELCNLQDEDCDGAVDEDFMLDTNVLNCGQCGLVCFFPNATPQCVGGACGFTDCNPGFHDINGVPIDGCEYACTVTNGGVEICDQLDNDCDGVVDGDTADTGAACSRAPGGAPTGECIDDGVEVCAGGAIVCAGATEPADEACDDLDNDCDGATDENITESCYGGPAGTGGVGECQAGTRTCAGGVFGACVGEVTPAAADTCNNADDDCDGAVDEAAGGGPITQTCYAGTPGTDGVGICTAGVQTCTFGVFGPCAGEVVDQPFDACGDDLDTDCDGLDDLGEGCLAADPAELRLDAPGGGNGSAPGASHSFDVQLAAGGVPIGARVYAVWSDLDSGQADVFFRRSVDGGVTWGDIRNLSANVNRAAVKPLVVVAPGLIDDTVHVVYQQVVNGVRDILVQTSTDSGASFPAFPVGPLDAAGDSFHHHAAVDATGDVLSVVWEQLDTATLTRSIRGRVSTSAGVTFGGERVINVGSGGAPQAGRPQAGVTGSGRFVYVWREARGGATNDVFAAFSDSPTAAIGLADEARLDDDDADDRNSDFPQLIAIGANVYVTWQDISTASGGGSDVVFVRSSDSGASYDGELVIDDPAGEVSASFSPSMAVDPLTASGADDRVLIAWEDRRQGTQVFVAVSTDAGATFSAGVRASSDGGKPLIGTTRNPRIVRAGGESVVVAYTNDLGLGTTTERVFASSSIDLGATWQVTHTPIDLGTGKALLPVAVPAVGGGLVMGAVIGWNDFRAGTNINGDPFIRRVGR